MLSVIRAAGGMLLGDGHTQVGSFRDARFHTIRFEYSERVCLSQVVQDDVLVVS